MHPTIEQFLWNQSWIVHGETVGVGASYKVTDAKILNTSGLIATIWRDPQRVGGDRAVKAGAQTARLRG